MTLPLGLACGAWGLADTLPPLTDRQRDSLARLLRTPRKRAA